MLFGFQFGLMGLGGGNTGPLRPPPGFLFVTTETDEGTKLVVDQDGKYVITEDPNA